MRLPASDRPQRDSSFSVSQAIILALLIVATSLLPGKAFAQGETTSAIVGPGERRDRRGCSCDVTGDFCSSVSLIPPGTKISGYVTLDTAIREDGNVRTHQDPHSNATVYMSVCVAFTGPKPPPSTRHCVQRRWQCQ